MMSNFEQEDWPSVADASDMNNQFERFELLSAYLDGEVTAEERQQVQQWLDTDPQFHQLYCKLSRLQREIPTLPVPSSPVSSEQLSQGVFRSIDRQNRTKRLTMCGGIAIATLIVGAISSLSVRNGALSPRFADIAPQLTEKEAEPLTIALNRPVVEIPLSAR
ncbi:putative transmembrane anti-sigma factor [Rippkaea orientalis PCC 8801]|uniref:Putative transmembrane anti-sigma factor n=1 Tax=Rippkaea orientalis (strain PCC 8801 / RF-1) TaxID=41431 RepID=B7K3B4_RIPO1|nr:zf-HC2 domain-containing protein [Rippkaea orientalis]ACK64434.1 putative transmembrane anti-sigma factor [Rippkaea orientalis PCC 8801]